MPRKITFLFLFFCLVSGNVFAGNGTVVLKDDLGHKITFTKPPEKVVTLAPNLTEMIFALGCGHKIIANTTYCNYPPEAKGKTKVGDLISVDYEKITELSPDLILMTVEGNKKNTYHKLKELGFKIFVSNPRNYAGIKKTFKDIAKIFRLESKADSIIHAWDKEVAFIRRSAEKPNKPKTMFVVSLTPLMLAGKNTFVNEYLKLCALKNIADDSPLNYPIFSREEVVKRNPEIIILPQNQFKSKEELLSLYPEWSGLKAIKENKIITVNQDLFFRPGPRFVEALSILYKKICGRR